MLNSLTFRLSVKILISPSNLNEILVGLSNLGYRFFPFISLNISCHSLLACRVSAEKSVVNLNGVPLFVICCFCLIAFNNFSLSLIFVNLITVCLGMFLLGFILPGSVCASWTWVTILSHVTEVFDYNLFKYLLRALLSSPSGTPVM